MFLFLLPYFFCFSERMISKQELAQSNYDDIFENEFCKWFLYAFWRQCWNLKLDYLLFPLSFLSVSLSQQFTCWQNVLWGLNFSLYVLPVLSYEDHTWQITFNCCSFLHVCYLTRGACGEGTATLCTAALLQPGSVSISTNMCHVLPRCRGFELTGVALELLGAIADPSSVFVRASLVAWSLPRDEWMVLSIGNSLCSHHKACGVCQNYTVVVWVIPNWLLLG